ncbi:hypothetical protein KCP71_00700 [Salmonella enterica subsp. enterica]|nr:hypothetical protein KCP71_00700 [Salmonella enterica subsp. enterica]
MKPSSNCGNTAPSSRCFLPRYALFHRKRRQRNGTHIIAQVLKNTDNRIRNEMRVNQHFCCRHVLVSAAGDGAKSLRRAVLAYYDALSRAGHE